MLNFDAKRYKYASHRNIVYGKNGMTCSTSPIATQVGMDMLKSGGNAVDAAIAIATTLPLTEPTGNGLGSDCFVLVWSASEKRLYGLDGSGVAPMAISAEKVREAGHETVPYDGWLPTMVAGAPSAWSMLREKFGTKTMGELMKPAIGYARDGFHIPVTVEPQWCEEVVRYKKAAEQNPETYSAWFDYFTKDGEPYRAGELFRSPDYAKTLESLAQTDCESYYRGEIMEKIVAHSKANGGFFEKSDFENYRAQWVEPISTSYKGYDIFEMPPNGHGITVLMAMNILSGLALSPERDCADTYHKIIEAVKLAFIDSKEYVADPKFMQTKVADMLSEKYAELRRGLISDTAIFPEAGDPSCGDTVYFCTADSEGNMVSFIQSNYWLFGSGIAVPDTGITLQNRGANFSMKPESDNYIAGGKKAYHTIIPGFLAKDGVPIGPFGVMGGFMQPQGHVQVLVNTIDYHMNPQECLDAPRFQWVGDKKIQLEREVPAHVAQKLSEMGHDIEIVNSNIDMGRGQIIWRIDEETLVGATEPRADGAIATC